MPCSRMALLASCLTSSVVHAHMMIKAVIRVGGPSLLGTTQALTDQRSVAFRFDRNKDL